jgi:thiol-disulfide isomerase/thioredoxin
MKRIVIALLILSASLGIRAQQLDSLTRVRLSDKLEEYFDAIKTLDVEAQKAEVDFIIEATTDSLVPQYVTVRIYDHYLSSPVMGSEAVAIHVLDKWFLDGTVKMYDEIDLLNARIFADFNRQSLIGQDAPQLTLLTYEGEQLSLYETPPGKYSVLYFYDTGCAKCKLENIRLTEALKAKTYPIEFYAVYAGDNREQWKE